MNRCFASSSLASTYLQGTSSFLNVGREDPQNGFGDYSSWNFADADWPHTGHLSSGMRRQATNALRPSGFTIDVQSLRPTAARAEQRSFEEDLKEEHSLRQANASNPDSPSAPLLLLVSDWC